MSTSDYTTHCIYRIVCFPNGKVYVGQTITPHKRRIWHFSKLAANDHYNKHLQNAYNKYGKGAFYFEIIEKGVFREEINEREIYWISYFNSCNNGFNATPGGHYPAQSNMVPCVWNGIEYTSIAEAARALGVDQSVMVNRRKRGHSSDNTLRKLSGSPGIPVGCTWNGIEYASVSECAQALGISVSGLSARLEKGYVCDADVPAQKKTCTWNGVEYKSIYSAAKANNLSKQAMLYRVSKGYKCDDDMPDRKTDYTWNGISYLTRDECAKANNVYPTTIWKWIQKGYTCDEDVIHTGEASRKKCTWNNTDFDSLTQCADSLGINVAELCRRFNKGYKCDDDMPGSGGQNTKTFVWNGIEYDSIKDAVNALGIGRKAIRRRMQLGWTKDSDMRRNRQRDTE